MKGRLHAFVSHHLAGRSKGHLATIENEGVRENLGDVFQLMMGSHDQMAAAGEFEKRVSKMGPAFDIETIEWFVEEKDVSFLGQGAGNEGSLLLAARELVDLPVGNPPEVHGLKCLIGFFLINLPEATEMTEMGKTSHGHDIANADGKMTLVLIDLGKVGDLPSGPGERMTAPFQVT